ncbi:Ycf66 family protein [Prochlorococcus sp. MIT 1307]|uniref:Ycf66 family protein n=1 Tax=Prochlorococcus sp. MIT 1307 TaxID=3096219 RepID=UPI002A76322D|nr:Ycf66 family protein [Prochlorococcus sp. MIT 1307]
MLAIFIGALALLLGFSIMLLPLLVTELSRPRDALWGAIAILLGLVLITSNDRLSILSSLEVSLGALLIGRLGYEVAISRWQLLSKEEKLRIVSIERWTTGFKQIGASFLQLGGIGSSVMKFVFRKSSSNTIQKKWVRPENSDDLTPAKLSKSNSMEKLQISKDGSQQQPKKTLEGQSAPKDS